MRQQPKRLSWCTGLREHALRLHIVMFGTSLMCLAPVCAAADCDGIDCAYNPQPAPGDYAIPMPAGLSMIFRKVEVPGPEFWGNTKRVVYVGDVTGIVANAPSGVFEHVHKQPISGAFPEGRHWVYYLGKYEVSIGQYAAVMGAGDLAKGIQTYTDRADLELDEKLERRLNSSRAESRDRALAEPLRLISWFDYQEFVHRYNQWCLKTASCRGKLPSLPDRLDKNAPAVPGGTDSTIGFFRLPTEVEWEYAARGGLPAQQAKTYEEPLPFPRAEADNYAAIKGTGGLGPSQIGKHAGVYGFHDLLGNVSELTAGPFRTESIQGKVGGLTTRGGNYLREARALRVSERAEETPYHSILGVWEAKRFSTAGIRLAIGSLVVPSARFRDDIVAEHDEYMTSTWKVTPGGMSLQDPVINAKDQALAEAQELLRSLQQANPGNTDLRNRVTQINRKLVQVDKKIEEGVEQVIDTLVTNAVVLFDLTGFYLYRIGRANEARETILSAPISGKTALLEKHDNNIKALRDNSLESFDAYAETVRNLQGYPLQVVRSSIQHYGRNRAPEPKIKAITGVLADQVSGPYDKVGWRQQIDFVALGSGVFGK